MMEKIIEAGSKWSNVVAKGKAVRFTALEDGANISLLLYNAKNTTDRYSMPDSLKAQHTSKFTKGNILMTDNGRAMASIIEDSLGWHDPIGGYSTRAGTDSRYGETTFQKLLNEYYRSGEENFVKELMRHGLTKRDLVPNINLFSKIYADEAGNMHFDPEHAKAGDTVTLRLEMDSLMILSNTPNPQDPAADFPSVPVKMEVFDVKEADENDYCVNYHPENRRAFENTWEYHSLLV